jgi:hypothetical protein
MYSCISEVLSTTKIQIYSSICEVLCTPKTQIYSSKSEVLSTPETQIYSSKSEVLSTPETQIYSSLYEVQSTPKSQIYSLLLTKKSHFYTSKYYGGLLINADWILPNRYVPKWTNEKITVMTQPFRKIRPGFYLAEDWTKTASKMSVFFFK